MEAIGENESSWSTWNETGRHKEEAGFNSYQITQNVDTWRNIREIYINNDENIQQMRKKKNNSDPFQLAPNFFLRFDQTCAIHCARY